MSNIDLLSIRSASDSRYRNYQAVEKTLAIAIQLVQQAMEEEEHLIEKIDGQLTQ